jgi:cysteine synthase
VSSGAAVHAALSLAADERSAGKTIVVLLADSAERYVTTRLFAGRRSSSAAAG